MTIINHMYEINEKDIDSVVNFLKVTDPEHATPEMAIAILEYLQVEIHMLSHTDPQKLEDMLVDLQKNSEVYHKLLKKVQKRVD
jgi:hypothetical protein